jgi:hypothetical protein
MNSSLNNSERDPGDWVNAGIIFFGSITGVAGVLTSCPAVAITGLLMVSWATLWFYAREGM